MIGNRGALLPARCKVTFSLGSVKRLRASPIRRKQLEGLWERIGNRGNNILVTADGWMVMSNGHTARFDWEDRDTIRFSDGGEDEGAVMKVAALSDAELKLLVDGRVLTFVRGQTLSEQEEARRTAEADERKAIARAKAAAAAAEVGKGVLKGAGYLALASLCVVAGVAAASTAGERSNEYDSDEGIGLTPDQFEPGQLEPGRLEPGQLEPGQHISELDDDLEDG
jgi:hypothetical protein